MIIILFMYIFSFKVFSNLNKINSTILVGILLSLYFLLSKKYRDSVFTIIKGKKVLLIFVYLINIILYCIFISTVQMTYEYSIIKTFLNQFINLNIGIFIYALYRMKDKESLVNKHIIYIFIIQAFIQLISFINPRINEFLNIFRYDGAIIVGQLGYGGIRGLSISGTSFFGLGVGYGLVYIYYFANWEKIFVEYKIFKYVFLLLLIFGGMSAARSSSIGLILGALYFIINKISKKNFKRSFKVKNFIMMFLIIILSTFSINIIKENESLVEKFQRMDRFVFQIIYNKQDTNKFTTSSTNVLFNNMYFGVREKTLLFGDGMYTNEDGSYYMYTDAGYMRNILYFGMIGVVFFVFFIRLDFLFGEIKNCF